MKNGFHPEKIFEGGDFPEVKVIENWHVLTEIIEFFIFKTVHVTKVPDDAFQIIIEPKSFTI